MTWTDKENTQNTAHTITMLSMHVPAIQYFTVRSSILSL
jgi:hypothetical protein